MAIKIGHASIDERGKIAGGNAGDQTKKELCTRTWYDKGWNVMLRPKKDSVAEKSAKACEQGCANDKIGYDQNQRNTLNTQAKKVKYDLSKITTSCEADCSAFMTVCAIAGGAKIDYGTNGPTTRTMRSKFKASGDYEVFTSSKYLTSDKYLERGDILIKEGSHTVMVLQDGSAVEKQEAPKKEEKKEEPKKTITTSKYYSKYTGKSTSIDVVLGAIGVPASYRGSYLKRRPLAKANGMKMYTGTSNQNLKLVELAQKGKLKKV